MTRMFFMVLAACFAVMMPAASNAQGTPAPARANSADVAFMQGMIGHHAQALQMTALVAGRASHRQLPLLAERISVSQQDEIAIMRRWLTEHGVAVPLSDSMPADHAMHGQHAMHAIAGASAAHDMPGMLSPVQMDSLTAARGADFDRLFLQYMIQHHEGALVMVAQLLASPAAARDPMIFQFASDVDTDQRAEIRRMRALLATLR